ncbi:MAG: hypothetical protein ACC654_11100 [Acidimicrobiia bacterium]
MTDGARNGFDDLLRRLEDARLSDDKIHERDSSLAERTASRELLMQLRAEMAEFRAGLETSSTDTGVALGTSSS